MNITIKRASLENLSSISELFNSYRVFYKQENDIELATSFISERIKNGESVIFYAHDDDNNYLGFTQLFPLFSSVSAKKSWLLNDLFVSENARKRGIARKLMNAAKQYALDDNAKGIALETDKDNVNAQALYESLDYKKSIGVYNYFLSLD